MAAAFRSGPVRRAALRRAARRGHALVLIYHRVTPTGCAPHEVVPSLAEHRFREHLEVLANLGDVVPLAALLDPPPAPQAGAPRLRFAVAFDDDYPHHVRYALPVLKALRAPATFFLSGRALHGLGGYWWTHLEELIAVGGLDAVRRRFGLRSDTPAGLAAECEGTTVAARLAERADAAASAATRLDEADVRALVDAGMTVGFHTLHHPVLPLLSDAALAAALVDGRDRLAAVARSPVELLSYPHGRADARVAAHASAAGYRAAFTTAGRPITPQAYRFLLGRWDPQAAGTDALVAGLALRLSRRPAEPPE